MNKKKIILNLSEETFQYLEVLAFGLNLEQHDGNQDNKELLNGHNKQNDDFAPLVSRMIEDIAVSLADGVRRPGAWERNVVNSLTGWNGTVNRGMFGELIDMETEEIK